MSRPRLLLRLVVTTLAGALVVPATAAGTTVDPCDGAGPTGHLAALASPEEDVLAPFVAELEDESLWTDEALWSFVAGTELSGGPAHPDLGFQAVAARLAEQEGPLVDTDLEALCTMAGLHALLVNDAPGKPEDRLPRGFFGPPEATADRFVVLVAPTILCAPLQPDPLVGLPLWHTSSPAGGVLAALYELWARRGQPPTTAGEAALADTGGQPARLRRALSAWVGEHWYLSPADVGVGPGTRTFAEMYALSPRIILPG